MSKETFVRALFAAVFIVSGAMTGHRVWRLVGPWMPWWLSYRDVGAWLGLLAAIAAVCAPMWLSSDVPELSAECETALAREAKFDPFDESPEAEAATRQVRSACGW